jgi:putative hydrolase of the HAD superfamily
MKSAAVIFDLDCTLNDRDAAIRKFTDCFLQEYGRRLSTRPVQEAIADTIRKADGAGYSSRQEVCLALANALKWITPATAAELLTFWQDMFPSCTVATLGMRDVLLALRDSNHKLGLISNGRGATQRRKLEAMQCEGLFDAILISGEVGVRKPDPPIFELALQGLGVTASEAWFVGDHPLNDVQGARQAGLRPVWLTGVHAWPKDLLPPAHSITRLEELIGLISGQRCG